MKRSREYWLEQVDLLEASAAAAQCCTTMAKGCFETTFERTLALIEDEFGERAKLIRLLYGPGRREVAAGLRIYFEPAERLSSPACARRRSRLAHVRCNEGLGVIHALTRLLFGCCAEQMRGWRDLASGRDDVVLQNLVKRVRDQRRTCRVDEILSGRRLAHAHELRGLGGH